MRHDISDEIDSMALRLIQAQGQLLSLVESVEISAPLIAVKLSGAISSIGQALDKLREAQDAMDRGRS
jgi:hypothetical protein